MDEKQDLRIEKGCIILTAANILVFLYMFTIGMAGDAEYMATHGAVFFPYMIKNGMWYPLVTAMFLHFDIEHLA